MITLQQAFKIAQQNDIIGVKLDKLAYDIGDCWVFDYGGEDEMDGFVPIVVKKDNGHVLELSIIEILQRTSNAKRVKV